MINGGPEATRPQGFWRRRVVDPLVDLLAQGLTPERLALSLAAGLVLGLFPIVGVTTLLCVAAGFAFRLNHLALQLANHLAYPLQLPLVLAFVRLGERLVGAPRVASTRARSSGTSNGTRRASCASSASPAFTGSSGGPWSPPCCSSPSSSP